MKKLFMALSAGLLLAISPCAAANVAGADTDSGNYARFWNIVQRNFASWDADHSGVLDQEEIDAAVQVPSLKGSDAAALSAIKVFLRGQTKKDDGVESFTLDALCPVDGAGQPTATGKELVSLFGKYCAKIAQESPRLYADGQPHVDNIHQGRSGDCYFVATAGGLAYHDPQRLKNLIVSNSDGTYTVTFPRRTPIVVPAPTDCEIACYSDAGADGLWLHVLEKAYATFKNRHVGKQEALDTVINGGSGGRMIMFVTGNVCTRYPTDSTNDLLLRQYLNAAMNSNKVVNTGTTGHCLTVLRFDPSSDQITIWNPWGTSKYYKAAGMKMQNGVFTMPFNDFKQRFISLLIEGDRPATAADYKRLSHHK